jgi:hypothetical protein
LQHFTAFTQQFCGAPVTAGFFVRRYCLVEDEEPLQEIVHDALKEGGKPWR